MAKGPGHHLPSPFCVPGPELSAFHLGPFQSLPRALEGAVIFPCFTAEGTQVQRSERIRVRCHSCHVTEAGFSPGGLPSAPLLLPSRRKSSEFLGK